MEGFGRESFEGEYVCGWEIDLGMYRNGEKTRDKVLLHMELEAVGLKVHNIWVLLLAVQKDSWHHDIIRSFGWIGQCHSSYLDLSLCVSGPGITN